MRKGITAASPFTAPVLSADQISSTLRPFVALQDLTLQARVRIPALLKCEMVKFDPDI